MHAFIHSLDSFGTVDGPGIRFVVFMQGCPLRCQYCHNPDTWTTNTGTQYTIEALLAKYDACKEFLKNGGVTVTGGEPLLQMPFVTAFFTACKARGIHTCLDTSGITFSADKIPAFDALMAVTDLVMLDIKHIEPSAHKALTGQDNGAILAFARYLSDIGKPMWVRHVVVPDITLEDGALHDLGYFLGALKNVKALDMLPYHDMGNQKYLSLGLTPPLASISPATKEQAEHAKWCVIEGIKKRLRE